MIAVLAKRPHAAGRNRNRIPPVDVNPKNSSWRPTGIFTISLFSDKKSKLNINRRLVDVRVSASGCWWENQANQAFLLATCFIYVVCWRSVKERWHNAIKNTRPLNYARIGVFRAKEASRCVIETSGVGANYSERFKTVLVYTDNRVEVHGGLPL